MALVGATATGKTAVGILLAERLGTEIIGCDSRQVYRGLAIGSAQPTPAECARVRHHLVAVADPTERYSAARYRAAVQSLLPAFAARGRAPLFVGGTGLYLRAALEGLCPAPAGISGLRRWIAALAAALPGGLHPLLARVDPVAAARIHPNDRYRLTRALEVFHLSGRTLTELQGRHRAAERARPARVFAIDLDGAAIRQRIALRLDAMLASGLLDEARRLLDEGLDPALPALRAVGYPQVFSYLCGRAGLDATRAAINRDTWQYARRQLTWFRAQPGITWVPAAAGLPAAALAEDILRRVRTAGGPS